MSETHQKFDNSNPNQCYNDDPNKNDTAAFGMAASGDEDEHPPILEPEGHETTGFEQSGQYLVGGPAHQPIYAVESNANAYALEDNFYVDNGILYQKPTPIPQQLPQHGPPPPQFQQQPPPMPPPRMPPMAQQQQAIHPPMPIVEANNNICCGLCGAIVPYQELVSAHLPNVHPEVLVDGVVDLEEIPYETWLNEQKHQQQQLQSSSIRQALFTARKMPKYQDRKPYQQRPPQQQQFRPLHSTRQLRRISQYRVNTAEMDIPELELALQKKMVEKMGRKVPVTLVDKLHAKCGICDTVISLNKKFEIVHLVRHFNAWHPSAHKCAGTWPHKELPSMATGKPLSAQDFAVIDPDPEAAGNLQCIWCGMFLSNKELGMHFHEIHPEEVEVPRCNLCMQELLINARLTERFGEDFGVTLPDEHTFRSIRFKRDFRTEFALEKAIMKYQQRIHEGADPDLVDIEDMDAEEEDEDADEDEVPSCEAFQNSLMNCGRRAKPKRKFIMPVVRQAAPPNSPFVRAITHSHWKCLLCSDDIYAAVISAGVIKHYKKKHAEVLHKVQFELCQARLEKISDGNMRIVYDDEHPEDEPDGLNNIECLICNHTIPMTPAFNICRAIRHIKISHPEVMPEHKGGQSSKDNFPNYFDQQPEQSHAQQIQELMEQSTSLLQQSTSAASMPSVAPNKTHAMEEGVIYATELLDFATMEMLKKNYNVSFDKVFSVYGKEIAQDIYVLIMAGDELDAQTVEEIVKARDPTQNPMVVILNRFDKQDMQQKQQVGGQF